MLERVLVDINVPDGKATYYDGVGLGPERELSGDERRQLLKEFEDIKKGTEKNSE